MTETQVQNISSDFIDAEVERLPHCMVEFRVTVKPSLIQKGEIEALKKVAKQVSIPGFRKGKAPVSLIKAKFSQAVEEETRKEVADEAFRDCQVQTRLPLLSEDTKIHYKAKSFSAEAAELIFKFETEPTVPDFSVEDIVLSPEIAPLVTDQEVGETVEQIRLFYAEWEEIQERPAQMDDYIVIDIEDLDVDPPTKPFENSRFQITKDSMAQWMQDLIIGLNTGENREGISRPDDTDTEEIKKAFTPKRVRITLKKIEIPHYPSLDDALAQKVGTSSQEELLVRIRDRLDQQAREKTREKNRDKLSDALLDVLHFDIPGSFLEQEMRYRMSQYFKDPVTHNAWKVLSKEDQEQKQEEFRVQSDKALRMFYISKKIAHDHSISVSDEELYPRITSVLDAMFTDRSRLPPSHPTQEQIALLRSHRMLAKTQDYLLEQISAQNGGKT